MVSGHTGYLSSIGIQNQVVDFPSIEVNRRLRRVKTDGIDGDKLLTMLMRDLEGRGTYGASCGCRV